MTDLSYKYRTSSQFTLGPLNICLKSSAITSIIGANGSGKSTLLKIFLRELVEYTGSYTIDGKEEDALTGDIMHRYKIGYLPEVPLLDDTMTGYEIASLVKTVREIDDDLFKDEIELFSQRLAIEEWFYSKKCKEYSLGMRKKTALVLALLGPLQFAILDEPTNGLDPLAVYGLKKIINYKHANGVGLLVTSHMLDFLEKIVHEVIFLKKGSVVLHDSLQQIQGRFGGDCDSLDEIYFNMHESELSLEA